MPLKKSPINLKKVINEGFSDTTPSLAEASIDYLQVEHLNYIESLDKHLTKHFQQRLHSGKSIIGVVSDIQEDQDDASVTITVQVDYSKLPYTDPSTVLRALRFKQASNSTAGSFVRAIPVDRQIKPQIDQRVTALWKCPVFTIEEINLNDSLNGGTLTLNGLTNWRSGGNFIYSQPELKTNSRSETVSINEGDAYIFDPSPDEHTAEAAYHTLQYPEVNGINSVLEGFIQSSRHNSTDILNKKEINEFLKWTKRPNSPVFEPNSEQKSFIRETQHEVAVLQGPPGTGKTSGALAPAIVSRLLAVNKNSLRTLVTGASNKAIDEVLTDVAELLNKYINSSDTDNRLDNVLVVRAQQPDETHLNTDNYPFDIAYTAFYGDQHEEAHIDDIRTRLSGSKRAIQDNAHIIVFATPRRVWRLGKTLIDEFLLGPDSDDDISIDQDTKQKYNLFDLLVVDESSMMDIPSLLLAGTYYNENGQILLTGDHRQLPPVQNHEWEAEYRPSITAKAPFLSTLNYIRMLNGDKLDFLDEDIQELIDFFPKETPEIPQYQLTTTYRCHKRIARFLNKWVYEKFDSLNYQSTQTETIEHINRSKKDGVKTAIDADEPFTLITYDNPIYQQSNDLETYITAVLTDTLPTEDIGVISPHNAQRGNIQREIGDTHSIDVDTVERFQGGERECIILNGTVSDPDYIDAESEFLLDVNRLNVGISRMKSKLIIIASEAIFNHIPLDTVEYDQSLLWKGLSKESNINDPNRDPDWRGLLRNFDKETDVPSEVDEDTTVSVYHVSR